MNRNKLWALIGGGGAGILVGLVLLLMALPVLRGRPKPKPMAVKREARVEPAAEPAPNPFAVSKEKLASLQAIIDAEAPKIPGSASVHLRFPGGETAGYRADFPKPAASVIKLPLMAVVEHAWRGGTMKRTREDERRVRKMITVSDNPAADALIERVGMPQVNAWLEDQGYSATRLKHLLLGSQPDGPNTVSAAEMTGMILAISEGQLVDAEASAEMRRILLASERRTRIPSLLPAEAQVGNKTGTLRNVVNDVAFIEAPTGQRYALAVLVNPPGGDTATSRSIARLSKRLYDEIVGAASE